MAEDPDEVIKKIKQEFDRITSVYTARPAHADPNDIVRYKGNFDMLSVFILSGELNKVGDADEKLSDLIASAKKALACYVVLIDFWASKGMHEKLDECRKNLGEILGRVALVKNKVEELPKSKLAIFSTDSSNIGFGQQISVIMHLCNKMIEQLTTPEAQPQAASEQKEVFEYSWYFIYEEKMMNKLRNRMPKESWINAGKCKFIARHKAERRKAFWIENLSEENFLSNKGERPLLIGLNVKIPGTDKYVWDFKPVFVEEGPAPEEQLIQEEDQAVKNAWQDLAEFKQALEPEIKTIEAVQEKIKLWLDYLEKAKEEQEEGKKFIFKQVAENLSRDVAKFDREIIEQVVPKEKNLKQAAKKLREDIENVEVKVVSKKDIKSYEDGVSQSFKGKGKNKKQKVSIIFVMLSTRLSKSPTKLRGEVYKACNNLVNRDSELNKLLDEYFDKLKKLDDEIKKYKRDENVSLLNEIAKDMKTLSLEMRNADKVDRDYIDGVIKKFIGIRERLEGTHKMVFFLQHRIDEILNLMEKIRAKAQELQEKIVTEVSKREDLKEEIRKAGFAV